jgi:hypothetical protein
MKFIINSKRLSLMLPFLFFLIPGSLFSKGSLEREQAYREEIQITFAHTVRAIDAGDMSGGEAKTLLAQVRRKHNRSYTDFSGMIDSLIDDVEEGRMDSGEAVLLYRERERQRLVGPAGNSAGTAGPSDSSSPQKGENDRGGSRPGSESGGSGGDSSHEQGQKGSSGKK